MLCSLSASPILSSLKYCRRCRKLVKGCSLTSCFDANMRGNDFDCLQTFLQLNFCLIFILPSKRCFFLPQTIPSFCSCSNGNIFDKRYIYDHGPLTSFLVLWKQTCWKIRFIVQQEFLCLMNNAKLAFVCLFSVFFSALSFTLSSLSLPQFETSLTWGDR